MQVFFYSRRIRVFLDGDYIEPPPHLLPPTPMVEEINDCRCSIMWRRATTWHCLTRDHVTTHAQFKLATKREGDGVSDPTSGLRFTTPNTHLFIQTSGLRFTTPEHPLVHTDDGEGTSRLFALAMCTVEEIRLDPLYILFRSPEFLVFFINESKFTVRTW